MKTICSRNKIFFDNVYEIFINKNLENFLKISKLNFYRAIF